MTRTRKYLLGGLALAAVVAGVATAAAHRGGFGHHGWHGGRHGGLGMMGGPLCSGHGAEMADHMAVAFEHRLKVTEAQKPALDELRAALKAGAAKVEAACPRKPDAAADGAAPSRPSPPERLALLETGLAARLDALRTVRPAANKFYATLSDEQKAKVAEMGLGRGHGWHGRRHGPEGRGDMERGEGRHHGPE